MSEPIYHKGDIWTNGENIEVVITWADNGHASGMRLKHKPPNVVVEERSQPQTQPPPKGFWKLPDDPDHPDWRPVLAETIGIWNGTQND